MMKISLILASVGLLLNGCATKPKGPTIEQRFQSYRSEIIAQQHDLYQTKSNIANLDKQIEEMKNILLYLTNQFQEMTGKVDCIEFRRMGDAVLVRGKRTANCSY
jgi:hypothetical protein